MPKKFLFGPFVLFLILLPLISVTPNVEAQIIDTDWIDVIESHALTIDANTTAEIVVCVFPSLYGHGIKDDLGGEINEIVKLGVYIFNEEPLEIDGGTQTGIGKSGKDNGVLVLVAMEEQQWRIEVGYGLEGDITDIESNLIAQNYLVPAFQQGNYGEGLYDTVVMLGEQIPPSNEPNNLRLRGYYYYESDGLPAPAPKPFWEWEIYGIPLWVIVIFIIFGVFIPVFGRRGGRGSGHWGGGRSGGGGSSGRW